MSSICFQGSSNYQPTPAGTRCSKRDTPPDAEGDIPWPRRCYRDDVLARNDCEANCDKYSWCIAYNHLESKKLCHLIKSKDTEPCPSGYTELGGPTITSGDQIAGVEIPSYKNSACYEKLTGTSTVRMNICLFGTYSL